MNQKMSFYILFIIFQLKFILVFTCPSECICNGNKVLCKHKNLSGVPKNIPKDTIHLDLSFNSIKHLAANSFGNLTNLKLLKLEHNDMKTIDENAFVGLEYLKDLYLSQNDLSDLHPEIFNKGLNKLLHLYLGNNEFESIPKLKTIKMTRLNLDSNKINNAYIDESFLLNINLQTLVLTKNFIKTIKKTDLVNLKNTQLINLMLKMNSLESIDPEAFVPVQHSLKTLELEGNKLLNSSVIERALTCFSGSSGSMLFLDLKSCGLTSISATFLQPFANSKLHQLDLSVNPQLKTVAPTAFQDLTRLQVLRLDHCRLSTTDTMFSALSELRELYLQSNNLSQTPVSLPGSLRKLELDSNHIRILSRYDFKSLSKLNTLQLSWNAIETIESGTFRDLSSLVALDLSHNRLSRLSDGMFVGLTMLEKLTLRKQLSCLKEIEIDSLTLPVLKELELDENCLGRSSKPLAGVFHHLGALQNLSMEDNQLKHLDNRLLDGLMRLKHLDLSKNEIVGWASHVFLPVVAELIVLDLSMNRIASVAKDCFEASCDNYMPNAAGSCDITLSRSHCWLGLISVAMDNNAWDCGGCDAVTWLVRHKVMLKNPNNVLCQSPHAFANLPVLEVHANCSTPIEKDMHKSLPHVLLLNSNIRSILGGIFGVFGLLTLVIVLFINRHWVVRKFNKCLDRKSSYRKLSTVSGNNYTLSTSELCPAMTGGDMCFENGHIGGQLSLGYVDTEQDNTSPVSPVCQSPILSEIATVSSASNEVAIVEDVFDIVFLSEHHHETLYNTEKIRVKILENLTAPVAKQLAEICECFVVDYPAVNPELLEAVLIARKRQTHLKTSLFLHAKIELDWNTFQLASFFPEGPTSYNDVTLLTKLINCL